MNAFEQVAVGANASASKGDEGESTAGFTEGLPQLNQYVSMCVVPEAV